MSQGGRKLAGMTCPPVKTDYFDHMVKVTPGGIYDFMKKAAQETGVVPTAREIADHFGRKSHAGILYHLQSLQKQGLVQKQGRRWRLRDSGGLQEIPLYGSIPAGFAEEAVQEAESTVRMDLRALGIATKEPLFFLRVRGDSMEGARIFDGDLALLERTEPHPGQIVAALIDGESTLKTYVVRRGVPYLRPENPKYPDLIPARELQIQGVLRLSLRQP